MSIKRDDERDARHRLAEEIDKFFDAESLRHRVLLEQLSQADVDFRSRPAKLSADEERRRSYFEQVACRPENEHLRIESPRPKGKVWACYTRHIWNGEMAEVCEQVKTSKWGLSNSANLMFPCFWGDDSVGSIQINAWAPPDLSKIPKASDLRVPLHAEFEIGREYTLPELCLAIAAFHEAHGEHPRLVHEASYDWTSRDPWKWAVQLARVEPPMAEEVEPVFTKVVEQTRNLATEWAPGAPFKKGPPSGKHESPSGRVLLFGLGKDPIVDGNVESLTKAQYEVVLALIQAGDNGLTKDQLVANSGHGDAVNILKRIAKKSPKWKEVVSLPGEPGKRYRIP